MREVGFEQDIVGAVELEGLEVLSRAECLRLLSTEQLGRVGVSFGALPTILPVNYALLGGDSVSQRSGYQARGVMVVGHSEWLADGAVLKEAERLPLNPWAPGSRDYFVRIPPEHVSGRRFTAPSI